jgi:NADH:ubiquinone reductase (H+-translocating)
MRCREGLREGFLNRLAKAGLAAGGTVAAVGALRRFLEPRPRYAPWEKPPYGEFPNRVLVLGGGFGGYTACVKNVISRPSGRSS